MLKKIIKISLLGVSALAIMNVNAATTSDTTQGVQSSAAVTPKHAKRQQDAQPTPVITDDSVDTSDQLENLSVQPSSTPFVPAGLYVSGQLGYATNGLHTRAFGTSSSSKIPNGIAGGVTLGYKLNNTTAVELGFLDLGKQSIKGGLLNTVSNKQYAIDIAGKEIVPLTQAVNVYGKLGVAYLTTHVDESFHNGPTVNINEAAGIAKHTWAPEMALGVSYNVTPNVSVDTSITHIHPIGSNRPGNINFMAVGLGYSFG